jgi:precorrin-2 dehydrogenase/sirohydrochlorin ferrochelatase
MKYYPVCLDLKNRKCAVVGGGKVAERKVQSLLKAKARVKVISPRISPGLRRLAAAKKISLARSVYQKRSLKGAFLVIAATDDEKINRRVSCDAARLRILSNIVDLPQASDFIVPALVEKKGIMLSVSTSGKAPCLARRIRLDLSKKFIPAYAGVLSLAEALRKKLKGRLRQPADRKAVLNRIINSGMLKRYAGKDPGKAAQEILKKILA